MIKYYFNGVIPVFIEHKPSQGIYSYVFFEQGSTATTDIAETAGDHLDRAKMAMTYLETNHMKVCDGFSGGLLITQTQ